MGGLLLLPMPDKLGRKGSFVIILNIYLFASAITLYSPNLSLKTIGMFIQGFFHIKNTLSYTHMIEILPEKNKELCLTFISLFDQMSLFLIASSLSFVTKNLTGILYTYNLTGSLLIILYLIIAPESPYFLITRNKKQEGIKVLNYIAWFNGSKNRIPEAA